MSDLVAKDAEGKLRFLGAEDKNNPPVAPREGSKMQCPVCKNMVDYLLGDVRQGCEACYDPAKDHPAKRTDEAYNKNEEML